jgi:hypothetical protein
VEAFEPVDGGLSATATSGLQLLNQIGGAGEQNAKAIFHQQQADGGGEMRLPAILSADQQKIGAFADPAVAGAKRECWVSEREIHWLAGYEAWAPVRIGNAAMEQHQLDVLGEMELAFRREIEIGFVTPHAHWGL